MDALPPHIHIAEAWDTANSLISAIEDSIKNGVLIHIPKFWKEEGKFLFQNFEILESRVECFLSDSDIKMTAQDFMRDIWWDINSKIREDFLKFLSEGWDSYNPCTPLW